MVWSGSNMSGVSEGTRSQVSGGDGIGVGESPMTDVDPAADRPRTNAEMREEATARMIDTAIRLIAEKGAVRLPLVDVGREAGYSHSLPNYYFRSKTRLVVATYRHIITSFQDRARNWIKARSPQRVRSGMENLEATMRAYLGLAEQDAVRARAMHVMWAESFSSMPELAGEVKDMNAQSLAALGEQIRAGIRRGEIDPDTDVEAISVAILGMLRGVTAQYLLEPETTDIERLSSAIVALVQRGIRIPGPSGNQQQQETS